MPSFLRPLRLCQDSLILKIVNCLTVLALLIAAGVACTLLGLQGLGSVLVDSHTLCWIRAPLNGTDAAERDRLLLLLSYSPVATAICLGVLYALYVCRPTPAGAVAQSLALCRYSPYHLVWRRSPYTSAAGVLRVFLFMLLFVAQVS